MTAATAAPSTSAERLRRHLHLVLGMAAYNNLSSKDKRAVLRRVTLDLAVQERKEQAAKRIDFRGVD